MSEVEKKEYEIALLVRAEGDVQHAKALLEKHGVVTTFESPLKQIQLAYPIAKEKAAVFCFWYGMADPAVINKLTNELRHESWCVRSLIVTDPVKHTHHEARRSERDGEYIEKSQEPKEQAAPTQNKKTADIVTNEDLEKKLEEILG